MFEKNETTGHWNETIKLTASDEAAYDGFGYSVSVSENVVIAGAALDDDKGYGTGSAYVFEKDELTGQWNETAKLTALDGTNRDFLGVVYLFLVM